MKTNTPITEKVGALASTIEEAKSRELTTAQATAIGFASQIVSSTRALMLLAESGAVIEGYAISRLTMEHLFNLSALLHDEKHFDRLARHSGGEQSRQLIKVSELHKKNPVLDEENAQRLKAFEDDPARKNDPKDGLNWEQISKTGKTDSLYVNYKLYSFLYAHSTMTLLVREISEDDTLKLYENAGRVLDMARLYLRTKLINVEQDSSSTQG